MNKKSIIVTCACLPLLILLLNIFFLLSAVAYAQSPDTLWTKTYGGTEYDYGYSVQQTSDDGYIIIGWTTSFGAGNADVYLIKTDSVGDTVWTKTYGGTEIDFGYSVQQTTDGGYIITGYTNSFGAGETDVYLIKTNSSGDTLWTKIYGGISADCGSAVQQTTDGGYIITGYTYSVGTGGLDVYLIKTNTIGNTVWTKTYGGADDDFGNSIQQTADNGYIITGRTSSFGAGERDVYLVKIDSLGDTLWTKTYGGTDDDWGRSVQHTSDGGYIIAGGTRSFGAGEDDIYLVKIDSSGDTLWTKTYGGTNIDFGSSIVQTNDGAYIIAGMTYSFGAGNFDVYLIKTDSVGDTVWTKTYGGINGDECYSVQQTTDGGYILAGATWSFGSYYHDVYLIKTEPDQGIDEHQITNISNKHITSTIFRGPLQLPKGRTCKVFDITGRVVMPETMRPGVYFIEVDGVVTKKVVKIR